VTYRIRRRSCRSASAPASYGVPDTDARRRRAWLAVETGFHLLDLAFREDPSGDPTLLREAVRMIESYLFAPED
jgi:hypothetical protein